MVSSKTSSERVTDTNKIPAAKKETNSRTTLIARSVYFRTTDPVPESVRIYKIISPMTACLRPSSRGPPNNSIEFRFIINATICTVVQVSLTVTSLRASSPIWASEMSLARTRPDLATTHHFPPFVPPSGLITQTKYFRKELAKQLWQQRLSVYYHCQSHRGLNLRW